MDKEQRIFPEMKFTCQTFIRSLSFVAENLPDGRMRNQYPELQIWRPQGNVFTKIHSTSGSPSPSIFANIYTYSGLSWAVQANDVLGVHQPEIRKSRYLFLLQENGGLVNYQLSDERNPPDSIELEDVSLDESDYPLISIQLNVLAPRNCHSGFLPFQTLQLKGRLYSQQSNEVATRYNRMTLIPGITFNCNGTIKKWTFAAEKNEPSVFSQYPSLEVWRWLTLLSMQRVDGTSLQTISRTDQLNVYEVTLVDALQVKPGDLLGIYQPSESQSAASVYYQADGNGPINYYREGGSRNLFFAFGSNVQTTRDLPLVNVEIVARCNSLNNPVNGIVQELDGGSTANYICDIGYIRQGASTRICSSTTGEWEGSAPSCNPVDCGPPESPTNGLVMASTTTYQSMARYSCDFGYRRDGPMERTCRNDGTWSRDTPTCEIVRCPTPEPPADGGVTVTLDTPGGVAMYSCEGEYNLAGSETRTCMLGGEWSGDEPSCHLIECNRPPEIANGWTSFAGTPVVNSVAVYNCNEGYRLIRSPNITCQANGTWTRAPECEVIECNRPPEIANGRTSFAGTPVVNSVAVYNCNEGYRLIRSPNITCQADGTWTSVPECEVVDCGTLSDPDHGAVSLENGTVFRSVAKYSCDADFMLNSSALRICQEDGAWSYTEPECMAVPTTQTMETATDSPRVETTSTTAVHTKKKGVTLADIVVIVVVLVLCTVIFFMIIVIMVLFVKRRKRQKLSAAANVACSPQVPTSFENPVYQGRVPGPSEQWSPTNKPEDGATPFIRPRARNSYDSGHFLYDQPSPTTCNKEPISNGISLHYGVHSILPPHLYDFPDLDHYETASNYSASQYETPVSPYEVPTPKTKSPTSSFASLPWGVYVPTEDQRKCLTSGGPTITSSNKNLAFFEEVEIYWKPASDTASLYAQFAKNKYREILKKQIQVTEHLGSGQFGMVDRGLWQSPAGVVPVAVKTLKPGSNESDRVKFLQEAAIMGQFQHPNVVKLHGVVTVGEPVMIVLELLLNGDLRNYLLKIRPAPGEMVCSNCPQQLLRFSRDIASGMEYLSGKSFVHRDLAARNILVADDKTSKISDFGLSRDLEDETYYISHGGKVPVKWTAPEALHYKKYSTASDVWSFGVVMYEIWSLGHKPFETFTNSQTIRLIDCGMRLLPPPGCPRAIYDLMMQCWHPETSSRPTFFTLFQSLAHLSLGQSEEDASADPSAMVLGAPLEAGQSLFQDLQNLYQ